MLRIFRVHTYFMRNFIYKNALFAFSKLPFQRFWSPYVRGAGIIFTLHHVRPWQDLGQDKAFSPNRLLEITPEFLETAILFLKQEGFDFIPLSDVPERTKNAHAYKNPFAVFTFDDGYKDNKTYAQPILQKHQVPWTLFIATDFADGVGQMWWLELERAVRVLDYVDVVIDSQIYALVTKTVAQKKKAFHTLYWALRKTDEETLRTLTRHLCKKANLDPLSYCKDLCMDWNELRSMTHDPLLTIGAHTRAHFMLAKHSKITVEEEMQASKQRLEKELGVPIDHFAYPVGDLTSAGSRE
jgi:peptidoglycan/xylan/chitin deacetylase (PgdA/CDA1 family)